MDVLKIESRLMADKISKLIGKEVFKKFKYNVEIQVNNLNISLTDKMGRVHLDVNAEIDKEELSKLLTKFHIISE